MFKRLIQKLAGTDELLEKFNNITAEKDDEIAKRDARLKELEEALSAKDEATRLGKPYVRVINVDIDSEDPGEGAFELEWNEIFVRQLQEAGYSGATPEETVDQWFTFLCRGIAEQER